MRFKDWLAEELSTAAVSGAKNPTAAAPKLNTAVNHAAQLPGMKKLASMGTGGNKQAVIKQAVEIGNQFALKNPLSINQDGINPVAISQGLLNTITPVGQPVPTIGGGPSTRKFAKKK